MSPSSSRPRAGPMWIPGVGWGGFLAVLVLGLSPAEGFVASPRLSPATSRRQSSHPEGLIIAGDIPPRLFGTTGLQATAKPAASEGGKRKLTPAEQLQYAITPEDILSLAAVHGGGSLKPTHLSQAVLRIGRALVQPRDAGQRRALRDDERLTQVLSAWEAKVQASPNSATPRHHSDLLLGLALLDYPISDASVGRMMEVFAQGHGKMSGEDVSNVGWALQRLGRPLDLLPDEMRRQIEGLPFKVLLGALSEHEPDVGEIMKEVEFRKDMMQIAGKEVEETRLTAWQGPQPFYYSGKEMGPSPMTPAVAAIRDLVFEKTGWYFDCVLLNLYAHGRVGMNYHIDPDQGVLWTDKTAVVSVGDSRYFCVRRIADHSDRHRFLVSGGDVVLMYDDCQEVYQHCVRKEEAEEEAGPRISLVFKESLHRKEEQQS